MLMENERDIVISIKPKYVKMILSRRKTVELRKSIFRKKVNRIYIYETAPVKKIVAFFPFYGFHFLYIADLWHKFGEQSGMTEKEFFGYFKKEKRGYAIEIKQLQIFSLPIDPYQRIRGFKAPQSYCYIPRGILK